uniref:Uncharacterized protein n=1 Tax=viral metagenome TaxID=1070528 RepID=A0A6C0JQ22_9ZZZZ
MAGNIWDIPYFYTLGWHMVPTGNYLYSADVPPNSVSADNVREKLKKGLLDCFKHDTCSAASMWDVRQTSGINLQMRDGTSSRPSGGVLSIILNNTKDGICNDPKMFSVANPEDYFQACLDRCGSGGNCSKFMKDNCGQDISDPKCLEWCMSADGMGKCDQAFDLFCSENKDHPYCSCINSPLTAANYNPLCNDRKCINGGYQTTPMTRALGGGCQIVDCSTALNIQAGGKVSLNDVTITQRCGAPGTQTQNVSAPSLSITNSTKALILIALLILVTSGVLLFVFL